MGFVDAQVTQWLHLLIPTMQAARCRPQHSKFSFNLPTSRDIEVDSANIIAPRNTCPHKNDGIPELRKVDVAPETSFTAYKHLLITDRQVIEQALFNSYIRGKPMSRDATFTKIAVQISIVKHTSAG